MAILISYNLRSQFVTSKMASSFDNLRSKKRNLRFSADPLDFIFFQVRPRD